MDEPWKISQFNKALVGKSYGFDNVTDASQIETNQGKTIKTEVGKIYYLEVSDQSDYEQRAFIGLRRTVNDKQIVTFYTVQAENSIDILLSSGGSVASTYTNHSLNDIYSATYDGKNFRIIEFNQIDWEERLCRDEEFTDENTGKLDTIAQKRCEASSILMAQRKLAFAINDSGNVMASGVVSDFSVTCNNRDDNCSNQLSNKVKSIKDVKEFTLGNMVCIPNASTTPNEAQTISCRNKTAPAPAPTPNSNTANTKAKSIANALMSKTLHEISLEEGKTVEQFFSIKKALKPCLKSPHNCENTIAPLVDESYVKFNRGIIATILLKNNNTYDKALFDEISKQLSLPVTDSAERMRIAYRSPVGREIMGAQNLSDEDKKNIFAIWYLRQVPYAGEEIWKESNSSLPWDYYLKRADQYLK